MLSLSILAHKIVHMVICISLSVFYNKEQLCLNLKLKQKLR